MMMLATVCSFPRGKLIFNTIAVFDDTIILGEAVCKRAEGPASLAGARNDAATGVRNAFVAASETFCPHPSSYRFTKLRFDFFFRTSMAQTT